MSKQLSKWAVALTTVMLTMVACAGAPTQRTAGETVDDVTVAARIKTALVQDDLTKARDINIEVNRGEVQLNGFVASHAERDQAGKIAMRTEGVTAVRNNLQVQTADRSGGEVIDDATITAKVKAALLGDARTKGRQIKVETSRGQVQLGGFVDSMEAKQAASEIAARVAGVKSVENDLQVKG